MRIPETPDGVARLALAEAVITPVPENQEMPWWPLLRPIPENYNGRHPEITLETLAGIAQDYSASVDIAVIDYDHSEWGPAAGAIAGVEFRDGLLWVQPSWLTPKALQAIKDREYFRLSADVIFVHKTTGRPYLQAVALLGAQKPALKGLDPVDPLKLAEPPESPPPPQPKETTMADEPAVAVRLANVERELATERHRRDVEAKLQPLQPRLNNAAFSIARELAMQLEPTAAPRVRLSATAEPVPAFEALIALLETLPTLTVTLGKIATGEADQPVDDKRKAELKKKYPTAKLEDK